MSRDNLPIETAEMSEDSMPIAVEDKFIVFALGKCRSMGPHASRSEELGHALQKLHDLVPVFDLRELENYYGDVEDFVRLVSL